MSYDDASKDQRRAVYDAAKEYVESGHQNEFLKLSKALEPPSPLPTDEELVSVYSKGCYKMELDDVRDSRIAGINAIYVHALRLAAETNREYRPGNEAPDKICDRLADEMEQR